MQQLLSMGFSDKLAAQALSVTGGESPTKAVEWILNQPPSNDTEQDVVPTPAPSSAPSKPPPNSSSQPSLHRFFTFPSKRPQNDFVSSPPAAAAADSPSPSLTPPQNDVVSNSKKRPKLPPPPLSERMRPLTLDDVVGQDHLLAAKSSLLRSAVDRGRLPSLVLWGPPGTGKTSIARALLGSLSLSVSSGPFRFVSLSAVTSGVKDVRDAVDEARREKARAKTTTLLFVDEVHRFNKSQLDSFLPIIEDGSVVFVGATTENPSFHLTTPLLSRCRVLVLKPLQPHHLASLLARAVDNSLNGLHVSVGAPVRVEEDAIGFISANCDGDARVALNALETAAVAAAAAARAEDAAVVVTLEDAKEALQCKHLAYDKAGEEHYNLISALHKSMRGGDANAGIYWLARMLEGGEQPLYIARRLIRYHI